MMVFRSLLLASLAVLLTACVWQPVEYTAQREETVNEAVAAFQQEEKLQRFFDEAIAYAVFPLAVRAGSGFGGAYGSGWLIENGEPAGQVRMFEFIAGPHVGGQGYRQILFFKDAASLALFKRSRFEFVGQANAALVATGASATPSYSRKVALFTQVRGGLLLEALRSAGVDTA